MDTSLKDAAKLCGISVEEIKEVSDLIGTSKGFITMWPWASTKAPSEQTRIFPC